MAQRKGCRTLGELRDPELFRQAGHLSRNHAVGPPVVRRAYDAPPLYQRGRDVASDGEKDRDPAQERKSEREQGKENESSKARLVTR